MTLFQDLLIAIDGFIPSKPMILESLLEIELRTYLESKRRGFNISRQVTKKEDRYDLLCRRNNELVCIELKLRANISDLKQFDRYLPKFRDGLIVFCWQATASVREIFSNVTQQSPIPVTLIELSKKYSLA